MCSGLIMVRSEAKAWQMAAAITIIISSSFFIIVFV
jgi:hypothetical protein